MKSKSKIYIFFFFLVLKVNLVDPNCETITDEAKNIFSSQGETQVLQLSNFFRGYNLQYTQSSSSSSYTLIPPFYLADNKTISPPIDASMNLLAFDILEDDNKIWRNQGSILLTKNTTEFTVRFGQLTKEINILINDKPTTISHITPTNCYDLVAYTEDTSIVDCQTTSNSPQDVFYLVHANTSTKIIFQSDTKIKNRNIELYQTKDNDYILSVPLTFVDESLNDKSYINVYKIMDANIQFASKINAASFGLSKLQITDITIDNNNNIYITDLKEGVIRFKYLDTNQITNIVQYKIKGENLRKIDTIINSDDNLIVVVAGDGAIYQLDWSDNNPSILRTYQLSPDVNEIDQIQINNQFIMLASDINFYFYRIGETRLKNLLSVMDKKNSKVLLDQSTPHAIVVGRNWTFSYIGSNGYLKIQDPQQKQTVVLTANSINLKTCSVTFNVLPIKDDSLIYQIKSLPDTLTIENPGVLYIPFQKYYIGSELEYRPIQKAGVVYDLKTIQNVNVVGVDLTNPEILLTYQSSVNQYYRVSKKPGQNITIELCSSDGSKDIKCATINSYTYTNVIRKAKIFEATVNNNKIPFLGFIGEANLQMIVFTPLIKTDFKIENIMLDTPEVTDFVLNKNFLFVTMSALFKIQIYKRIGNSFLNILTISQDSFTAQQIVDFKRFKPHQVLLTTIDPAVLYIKNLGSIIIVKFNQNAIFYLTTITVIAQPSYSDPWEVVIGKQNMLIILGKSVGNSILEYAIYDVYNPLKLKDINLLGNQICEPVYVVNNFGQNLVYLKTQNNGRVYITNIIMQKPGIISNYYYQEIALQTIFVVASLQTSSIVQIVPILKGPIVSVQIYENPSLLITAANENEFKKTFKYGFVILGKGNNITYQGLLNVFNYQTSIKETSSSNSKLNLPKTADQTIQLASDSNFDGAIDSYSIDCEYCKNKKFTFLNHLQQNDSSNPIQNLHSILHFPQENRILMLTNNIIYTANQQNKLSAPPIFLGVTDDTICEDWALLQDYMIIIFCESSSGQFFIPVSKLSVESLVVFDQIPIPGGYRITNPLKMVTKQNRIFILDNNIMGDGNGIIRIFKAGFSDDDQYQIDPDNIIDYANFGAQNSNLINDFNILDTDSTKSRKYILLVTLSEVGLGYGVYDPQIQNFEFQGEGTIINLQSNPIINKYTLDDNKYLKSLLVYQKLKKSNENTNVYSIVIVVSSGVHMHLDISFICDAIISFKIFQLFNTYNKYGNQIVLNWVEGLWANPIRPNYFLLGYLNTTSNRITISLYNLNFTQNDKPINFRSSLKQEFTSSDEIVAFLYRTQDEEKLITKQNSKPSAYRLDDRTYIKLLYNNPGNFDKITLIATNDFSQASHLIPISFDKDGSKGLKWYIYVAIAGGIVLLLIISILLYKRYKTNKAKKDKISLISQEETL